MEAFETTPQRFARSEAAAVSGHANREMSAVGSITPDQFFSRYLERRDELAYRALRNEALTPREWSTLAELNAVMDQFLPQPQRAPASIVDAADELRKLLRR